MFVKTKKFDLVVIVNKTIRLPRKYHGTVLTADFAKDIFFWKVFSYANELRQVQVFFTVFYKARV